MQDNEKDFQNVSQKKKFWMFVHVTARRLLEGLFISSSLMVLWSIVSSTPVSMLFLAIMLLSLLLRIWLWSRDIEKYGAVPEYDHYRLFLIEQRLGALEVKPQ